MSKDLKKELENEIDNILRNGIVGDDSIEEKFWEEINFGKAVQIYKILMDNHITYTVKIDLIKRELK